jgi:hypothetical protein
MDIALELIKGLCFGIEYFDEDEDYPDENVIIVSLLFIRVLIFVGGSSTE